MADSSQDSRTQRRDSGKSSSAYFLVGPTASGKTAIAQHLAETRGMGVLSADSMLVYRGLDIGTAKPSRAERERVPYFGVDLVEPHEAFSVGAYLKAAVAAFEEASAKQYNLIVAGGTGLYVKCLTEGLDPASEADSGQRSRAEGILEAEGVEGLQRALQEAAPERCHSLSDRRNPRRLIRALELAWKGEPLRRSWAGRPCTPLVGLMLDADVLKKRIRTRVREMYEGGLLDEARRLKEASTPLSGTARHAIGYAEAFEVIENRRSLEEAMKKTEQRTCRLAKKQATWFRHQAFVEWIPVEDGASVAELAAQVAAYWEKHGPTPVHI